jgi:VIT1/CCC1 family predicted Fe2+/Mn2+ transporter
MPQLEVHFVHRTSWLRAAVLGANDGIVSTSSLLLGVAAADAARESIVLAGIAGVVAGAMSMAAGEYVSVHSQKDTEQADLERERRALEQEPHEELEELTRIYRKRGVDDATAKRVARQLMAEDALAAHARDELGISDDSASNPLVAALASAAAFTAGALLPMIATVLGPFEILRPAVAGTSLVALAGLGALGARVGGAPIFRAALRVTVWGAFAMVATSVAGLLFGATV